MLTEGDLTKTERVLYARALSLWPEAAGDVVLVYRTPVAASRRLAIAAFINILVDKQWPQLGRIDAWRGLQAELRASKPRREGKKMTTWLAASEALSRIADRLELAESKAP